MKIVIDTNVFTEAINAGAPYHPIFLALLNETHRAVISNEILSEYFEIFDRLYDDEVVANLSEFFEFSESIVQINLHYRFNLIQSDPDDNKFVDAAICGNTDYLITSDRHFDVLKTMEHPKVNVISPQEFIEKFI